MFIIIDWKVSFVTDKGNKTWVTHPSREATHHKTWKPYLDSKSQTSGASDRKTVNKEHEKNMSSTKISALSKDWTNVST